MKSCQVDWQKLVIHEKSVLLKRNQVVLFSETCFGITMAWGITVTWCGASVFTVGAGVGAGVGGIGQSFLISNKFLDADPVLGQGVFCLTGAFDMSSSGGGLEL